MERWSKKKKELMDTNKSGVIVAGVGGGVEVEEGIRGINSNENKI